MTSIGLEKTEELFKVPKNQNESLSALGIEILRRVNQRVPVFVDESPNPLRANLRRYFEKYLNQGPSYLMPEELFYQYEMEFEESNEWVRQNYFPEKERLFPKATYPDTVRVGLSQDELDNIANMIASLWVDKQTEILNSKPYQVSRLIKHFKQWIRGIQ